MINILEIATITYKILFYPKIIKKKTYKFRFIDSEIEML